MRGRWKKIGILPCRIWAVKDIARYHFIIVGVGVSTAAWSTKNYMGLLKLTTCAELPWLGQRELTKQRQITYFISRKPERLAILDSSTSIT
jgi:hypothetical protein